MTQSKGRISSQYCMKYYTLFLRAAQKGGRSGKLPPGLLVQGAS